MANWRQDDDPRQEKKIAAPKPAASKQAVPKLVVAPTENSPQPAAKTERNWRSQKLLATDKPQAKTGKRIWNSASNNENSGNPFASRKWPMVIALGATALALVIAFILWIIPNNRELQLMVLAVEDRPGVEPLSSNPFGKAEAENFKQLGTSNRRNLRVIRDQNSDGNDALLKEIAANKNWFRNQKFSLAGSGPGGNAIAFYVNCSAVAMSAAANSQGTTLYLVPTDAAPYWPGQDTSKLLSIATLLQRVAEAIPRRTYAWLALDVKPPPVLASLGELDFPIKKYVTDAFDSLPLELQDRLVVTLPCDSGQENWLAPEFGSTAFGHFYREFLTGEFDQDKPLWSASKWTLEELRERFDKKLSDWAAVRRYAKQVPQWVMSKKTENKANKIFLFSTLDARPARALAVDKSRLLQNFETLDGLWKDFSESAANAWQWDPLGYAEVETGLLQLENLAESDAEQFESIASSITARIGKLKPNLNTTRVSLIENRAQQTHLNPQSAKALDKLKAIEQAWIRDGNPLWKDDAKANAELPAIRAALNRDQRAELIWNVYLAGAASQSASIWQSAFEKTALEKALQFIDESARGSGALPSDWVEIQLLAMLHSEIDWERDSLLSASDKNESHSQRSHACALAVSTFGALQELATRSNPEISRWTAGTLLERERKAMHGMDRLLAGEFSSCVDELTTLQAQIESLRSLTENIQRLLDARDRGYAQVPHLLGWLLREYQFVEAGGPHTKTKQHLEKLGSAAALVSKLARALREAASGSSLAKMEGEIAQDGKKLQSLLNDLVKVEFEAYVNDNTSAGSAPKENPQTHRRDRVALRAPFLSLEQRQAIHLNVVSFLSGDEHTSADAAAVPSKLEHRLASEGANFFIARLGDSSQSKLWKAIATENLWSIIPDEFRQLSMPSDVDVGLLRQRLADTESALRPAAVAFGQWNSLRDSIGTWEATWPWSAAVQRQNLDRAVYGLFQSTRLAEARWGIGEIGSLEDSYYYRLAQQYMPARALGTDKPLEMLSSLLDSLWQKQLRDAHQTLSDIKVQFGKQGFEFPINENMVPAQIKVSSANWPAIASVYLGTPGKRMAWEKASQAERGRAVDLGRNSPGDAVQWIQNVELQPWKTASAVPSGTLAIRGNHRIQPIEWKRIDTRKDEFELRFALEQPNDARLTVLPPLESPLLNVYLLLDSSQSMEQKVEPEGNRKQRVPVFELAREAAKNFVQELGRISENNEANVRLGVLAFGLKEDRREPLKRAYARLRPDHHGSSEIFATEVQKLDQALRGQLESLLDDRELQPSGCTPLYDAIVRAARVLQNQSGKKLIYVLSDGVDDTSSDKYRVNERSSKQDVINKIRSLSDCELRIFFFQNSNWYVREELSDDQKQEDALKHASGVAVLRDEFSRALGSEHYRFDSREKFGDLRQSLLDSIPRTNISVTTTSASKATANLAAKFTEPVIIPKASVPCDARIELSGPLGSAEQQVLFAGGEHLKVEFDPRARKLLFPKFANSEVGFQPLHMQPWQQQQVWIQPVPIANAQELFFRIGFNQQDQNVFTQRPGFLLVEVARVGGSDESSLLLADFQFEQNKHFPIARTVKLPWPVDARQAHIPGALVKAWVHESRPKVVHSHTLSPKKLAATDQVGNARIEMHHIGGGIEVQVKRQGAARSRHDRLFVQCPNALQAVRTYRRDGSQEIHRFTLAKEVQNRDCEIAVVSLAELDDAAANGKVTALSFEEIEIRSN